MSKYFCKHFLNFIKYFHGIQYTVYSFGLVGEKFLLLYYIIYIYNII